MTELVAPCGHSMQSLLQPSWSFQVATMLSVKGNTGGEVEIWETEGLSFEAGNEQKINR